MELKLTVCHFPPGTSKWNKIEHRLFSFVTQNWRGKPLVSHQAIVNLIASTTTQAGLIVKAALDTNQYPTSIKVTDAELAKLRLKPHNFHGEWNYALTPRPKTSYKYFSRRLLVAPRRPGEHHAGYRVP